MYTLEIDKNVITFDLIHLYYSFDKSKSITNESGKDTSKEYHDNSNSEESSDEYEYYSDEDHYAMESSSESANEVITNQQETKAKPRTLNFPSYDSFVPVVSSK